MLKLIIISAIIFILAVVMTMAGRGGGNFYVLLLVLSGIPIHQAVTTGQFTFFRISKKQGGGMASGYFHRHTHGLCGICWWVFFSLV